MATGPDYSARRSRLTRSFKSAGVDALLVTGLANVRYLTGFTGDSTWLYLSKSATVLISDTRYETQIANECDIVDVDIRDARKPMKVAVSEIVKKAKPKRLGFEPAHVTFGQHADLSEEITAAELVPTGGLTERLREVKDKWELQQIRDAVHMAERGIAVVRSGLTLDQTEQEIRYILEAAMRSFGATGPGFEPIVGVGPTAALPHAHAGDLSVSESPILLIDWGAETKSGYRSDLTRVFVTGKPSKQMEKVYNTVQEAQQAAIAAIKPGVKCVDVDTIARNIIADAGFGKRFGHGLGHGFGLEIHESVRMSPLTDQVFEPGMVVTVEPGIYLPGKFGVRIEDDILVTRDGHEVLSSVPREFDDAIVEFLA
ncbi:M24 family metallopeptidase [Fuerstiella marisgermanici]|uniref:Putative peptidase n=1 Tax=Fuerstiella marisgermanici TaxID=1891926 RepID=A0A1P8WJG8_9PLAN|nr:Xaa-Pro peptidase family protein [Fuerstiella marisgermanici]APZ94204.1 putative peptidase [Fuerstiella marisgermanici]